MISSSPFNIRALSSSIFYGLSALMFALAVAYATSVSREYVNNDTINQALFNLAQFMPIAIFFIFMWIALSFIGYCVYHIYQYNTNKHRKRKRI